MGQDKGQASTNVESRDPEEIKEEIEQSREELGDTVAAVTEKADVKQQAKNKVSKAKQGAGAKKDAAKQKASAAKNAAAQKASATKRQATAKVSDATPESAGAGIEQAQQVARENPAAMAVAIAVAGGFILGWLFGRR
jgi:ElaB/YqjD/DUF883 family membrane-anchored ribosome-binding protein